MSADTAILGTCLEKMWVVIHENVTTNVRQLGADAQRLEWWENCIGNRQEKRKIDHDRNNIRYYR